MAPHACPNCRRLLHFEARVCPGCGFTLGYDPGGDQFLFLGDGATTWRDAEGAAHATVVCANNNAFEVCNWLVETDDSTPFCRACRHNRTIPDLSAPRVPERWGKVEAAKRRLFHSLLRLGLPLETQAEAAEKDVGQGLAFDILYDASAEQAGQPQIMTGHQAGLITLNLIEADDAQRERIRTEMGEPYRTLLGHFRHEVGHHYWSRLIERDQEELGRFRQIFGDETVDYHAALQNHYGNGGGGWSAQFVSAYATSHPWEDFAETFAHYLHMVDTLATIGGFGMRLDPFPGPEAHPGPRVDFDPYRAEIRQLADHWIPMSFALNAISRSMGQPDLYPFRLTEPVIGKLAYVRDVVARAAGSPLP
jgi:hypothetical protein